MKLLYEMPGTSMMTDVFSAGSRGQFGPPRSHAQYTPPLVEAPKGDDRPPEPAVQARPAEGLQLELFPGLGSRAPGVSPTVLDMSRIPSDDELLELTHRDTVVPLDEVKRRPGGSLFPETETPVAAKDPGWEGRLDVGHPEMLADMADVAIRNGDVEGFAFRLISRRMPHVYNSPNVSMPTNRRPYNPAFLHPDDMRALGVEDGGAVTIRSERATITAVAEPDAILRPGLVSISHSWGDVPDAEGEGFPGAPTGRLIANDVHFDRFSGQPRMSNLPVDVTPCRDLRCQAVLDGRDPRTVRRDRSIRLRH